MLIAAIGFELKLTRRLTHHPRLFFSEKIILCVPIIKNSAFYLHDKNHAENIVKILHSEEK